MKTEPKKKAVIYCRVSSVKQLRVGDGLNSQQATCREYARLRGYEVVAVFEEEISGRIVDRPRMKAMLAFLKKNPRQRFVVVIDDISRLARDIRAHLDLRDAIALAGAELESPTMTFSVDKEVDFQEIIMAGLSHEHRRKNAEQTKARMRARVMNGFWPFACPIGYTYVKSADRGKVLVRDEPLASIITEALEGYASGRFQLQAEVRRFLEAQPEFPEGQGAQRITDILTRVIYAGYVEAPKWGIGLRKGHHPALISFETHKTILERIAGNARAPKRKDLNLDFPLRGFVVCGDCGSPLTGCWSKGRSAHHPYYLCIKKGCESYGKSVRRDALHGQFDELLMTLRPTPDLFRCAYEMFEAHWNHLSQSLQTRGRTLKAELAKIEKQSEQFLDRIAETTTPSVIAAYENRIRKLDEERVSVSEKIANCGRPLRSFDESLRTALEFVANPCFLWNSEHFEDKQAVLKLAFDERLAYVRNEGFRTANMALPFKALADLSGKHSAKRWYCAEWPNALGRLDTGVFIL